MDLINVDNLKSFFKDNKKKLIPILFAVIGVLLLICPMLKDKGSDIALSDYKRELESELEDVLSKVDGVGRCCVTLTFAEGESAEYKGSKVISTSPPRVMGVSVVCEGGGSAEVSERISELLCALFDIGANRVSVLKMKK